MPFREQVLRALAEPFGGPLARRIRAAAQTVLVLAGGDGERERIALAAVSEALVRAGVPRGRQCVLADGGAPADRTAFAKRLREALGMPVLLHDPGGGAVFSPGTLTDGLAIELDDELREAEEVVLVGRFSRDEDGGVQGGPAALWPALAPARARLELERRLAALPPGERVTRTLAISCAALALVPAGFALVWSAGDPPRVLAGDPDAVWEACARERWLAAP